MAEAAAVEAVTPPTQEAFAAMLGDEEVSETPSTETKETEKPVETKAVEPEKKEEPKKEEAKPVEAKTVETKPVEPVKAEPAVKPVEVKQPEVKTAEPVKPVEQQKPVDIAALRKQTRDIIKENIKFTPEEIELLRTEPEKIFPDLIATAQLQTYEAVTAAVLAQLPAYLSGFQQQITASSEAEKKFTARWPQLADAKFHDEIRQTADFYKQVNPNSTMEDRIEKVGAMLAVKYGLLVAPVAAPVTTNTPAPPATTQPVSHTRPGTVVSKTSEPVSPFVEFMNEE